MRKFPLGFTLTGGGGSAPASQPLRFATNSNFFPSSANVSSGTRLMYKNRSSFFTGSGALSQIVLSAYNLFVGVGGVTFTGNSFTIHELD